MKESLKSEAVDVIVLSRTTEKETSTEKIYKGMHFYQ